MPEPNNDYEFDHDWIDQQVERLFPALLMARLDRYLSESIRPEALEHSVIRSDLRSRIVGALNTPFSESLIANRRKWDRERSANPAEREAFMEKSRSVVETWNKEWDVIISEWGFGPAFWEVGLGGLVLHGIDLRHAYFKAPHPVTPGHYGAKLKGARLDGAFMGDANFNDADLRKASLVRCTLRNASMIRTKLEGADLSYADLRGAVLTDADLRNVILRHADLTGAVVHGADMDHADLFGAKGLRLDANSIYRTRFTDRSGLVWRLIFRIFFTLQWVAIRTGSTSEYDREKAPHWKDDPWNHLRRIYTGPRFMLTLLLVLVFILPKLFEVPLLAWFGQLEAGVLERVPSSITMPQPRTFATWEIILGLHKTDWVGTTLVIVLIIYNTLRGILTMLVSRLRDAEERNWVSPARVEYMPLYAIDRVVQALSWVAVAFAFWVFFHWLDSPVLIP